MTWDDIDKPLKSGQAVQPYQHLMTRIDPVMIEQLVAANQQ
jgi:methionyl-tRNA synthetase